MHFAVGGLSNEATRELTAVAKRSSSALLSVALRSQDSPIVWARAGAAENVQLFSGEAKVPSRLAPLQYMCAHTQVHATLSALMPLMLYLPLHGDFRRYVHDSVVINSHTLFDIEKPELAQPYRATSINWMSIRSASSLMQNRDFVYVQHQDELEGPTKGWVSCMHSVNLPSCPPLSDRHSLVRGGIYSSGFVFRASKRPGILDAVFVLQVDFKGKAPRLLCTSTLKQWATSLGRIAAYFARPRHLVRPSFALVDGDDDEVRRKSDVCRVCDQALSGFRIEKETCRKCQVQICSKCAVWSEVELDVVGILKVLVCTPCAVKEQHRLQSLLESALPKAKPIRASMPAAAVSVSATPAAWTSSSKMRSLSLFDEGLGSSTADDAKGMIPLRYSPARQSYQEVPCEPRRSRASLPTAGVRSSIIELNDVYTKPIVAPRFVLGRHASDCSLSEIKRAQLQRTSLSLPVAEPDDSTRCVYDDPDSSWRPLDTISSTGARAASESDDSDTPSMVQLYTLRGSRLDTTDAVVSGCLL
ncbi:hypothetical protein SPRG_08198 [Saprolegnia parasitica CBS 223.65]|uniref:START domain-containing protein n=1 Tax=Saprolegnia parasitica (strain CBS 223.65) TaxID=695850 RepID=A0A067CB29_SAPPC|nr:hypothetical protein SPRG_08198 [Saprolegnia parasitica CBS 223.65]KDO26395.1 hypothetical protein SPRG_08198 [Saprolegnia parasitica CBS 223.65]|eukprot:XP_012202833.1 hypothetical protein SPRG_08198 [Saprolegnia parasitica CBS 223.65]